MGRSFEGIEKNLKSTYDTSIDNVIDELYAPLFRNSVRYVRAAGFFRSSVFRLMTDDLLEFAISGGKMTLITSLHVDKKDYDTAMEALRTEKDFAKTKLIEEIISMRENEEMVSVTEILASLICNGCLSIRIGLRKSGIYHRKKGYFEDSDGKKVLFMGSGNETRTALDSEFDEGSAEDFSVYRNWGEAGAWESHGKSHYDKLQLEIEEGEYHRFPIVPIEDLDRDDFFFIEGEDWLDLETHRKLSKERKERIREVHDKFIQDTGEKSEGPGPLSSDQIVLRPHQSEGLSKWEDNGCKGILEHATGSGKTITALTKIAEHSREGLPVLVLVPSKVLLDQWIDEINKFMSPETVDILPVGSGHREWRKELALQCHDGRYQENRRITVAIIHSARTNKFLSLVGGLKSALVVVDECHRIGAPSFKKICEWKPAKVLGLSATPDRYGDSEGTERLKSLCGEIVHQYSLTDALKDGYLTPYIYHIERVKLTDEHSRCIDADCRDCERSDYDTRMTKIARELNRYREQGGSINWKDLPQWLRISIIQAKRIIKKAKEKSNICARIIYDNYSKSSDTEHWLVYCEDSSQLEEVNEEISKLGIGPVYEYWTGAEGAEINEDEQLEFDRAETLRTWEITGGVMLSIQCLDEGVNIEKISHGIILASSNNPRQFIQRRGRMLRLHEDKTLARIWDALVIPESENDGEHNNYVLNEINRASLFAMDASGGSARQELTNIRHELGLNDHFADGEFDGSNEEDE